MDLEKLSSLLKNKKTQNFFIYGVGQAFNLISPLLVIPYIVAVCGEEGLGKTGLGFALSLFLILIVDYAFDVKGTKQASEMRDDRQQLEKLFINTIAIKCLLFLAVVAIFLALVFFVPFFQDEKPLFALSLSIVLAQVFTPHWFLQGTEQYTAASIINICSKGFYLLLVYSFVANNGDYIYVNLFLGGSSLVFNIVGLAYIMNRYSFKIAVPVVSEVTAILKGDFSFCISQLFLSARQLLPIVLVSYCLGYYTAGQYKIIEQVITSSRTFIQVFLRYFYPLVCYKAAEDLKAGFRFWKRYSTSDFLIVLAAMSVIALMPEQLLYFFNASEESVNELTPPLFLVLLVPPLMAASTALEQLMMIANRNKEYIRIVISVTIISIVSMFSILGKFGIIGLIATFIAAELLFISLYFKNSYLHLSHKTNE
ncbi:oligosaccharide flippase family protein [Flavobacterium sp. DGU11]|uniref:Oligosaccharide flippase family protein n=1 Tax=Flavobacterium arundinis TaxID=3139143 RepID=A0ABU9I0R6_9FLAO